MQNSNNRKGHALKHTKTNTAVGFKPEKQNKQSFLQFGFEIIKEQHSPGVANWEH